MYVNLINQFPATESRMQEIRKAQEQDPVSQKLCPTVR